MDGQSASLDDVEELDAPKALAEGASRSDGSCFLFKFG